jgi:hypothetical protein
MLLDMLALLLLLLGDVDDAQLDIWTRVCSPEDWPVDQMEWFTGGGESFLLAVLNTIFVAAAAVLMFRCVPVPGTLCKAVCDR